MKNMTTWKFFGPESLIPSYICTSSVVTCVCPVIIRSRMDLATLRFRGFVEPLGCMHHLSANNANIFPVNFICSSIRITSIHIFCGLSVANEIANPFVKRAHSDRYVAYYVYWHAVEHAQNREKCQVQYEFAEIWRCIRPCLAFFSKVDSYLL